MRTSSGVQPMPMLCTEVIFVKNRESVCIAGSILGPLVQQSDVLTTRPLRPDKLSEAQTANK